MCRCCNNKYFLLVAAARRPGGFKHQPPTSKETPRRKIQSTRLFHQRLKFRASLEFGARSAFFQGRLWNLELFAQAFSVITQFRQNNLLASRSFPGAFSNDGKQAEREAACGDRGRRFWRIRSGEKTRSRGCARNSNRSHELLSLPAVALSGSDGGSFPSGYRGSYPRYFKQVRQHRSHPRRGARRGRLCKESADDRRGA